MTNFLVGKFSNTKTTEKEDAEFRKNLPPLNSKDWYGPCNSCINFSEKQYDSAPGTEIPPPDVGPVPSNPPPLSFTTQAAE